MLKSYNKGFTLIEILFVIAILSVLASLGLSVLQQRAQQLKVEKVALQMQQILQAGMAFKADSTTSDWPASCADPDFKTKYLPVNSESNPWGNVYTCQPTDPDKKKFRVTTTVPNTKIVEQIKALLPNAGTPETQTTPPTVYTEVSGINTGGGTGPTSNLILVAVDHIQLNPSDFDSTGLSDKKKTITFTCPPGSGNGHLFLTTKQIQSADNVGSSTNIISNLQFEEGCNNTGQTVTCPVTARFQMRYNIEQSLFTGAAVNVYDPSPQQIHPPTQTGLIDLQYIAYCIKSS